MYEIAIEDTFDAAHCLRDYEGNCRRLHGHTYRVRAAFRFRSLDNLGMAMDFRKAKDTLRAVLHYMDHHYINELPEFSADNPTAENIAKFLYDRIKADHPETYSVSVWETPTSCATYFEED
jgi:6-pyruvoyltetrahydropterin/6-carboxytetrahydropterin synthase